MRTLVFDFGGVLVDWNPRYLYRKIFASSEEMEWFLAHVCTPTWNAAQDAGRPFAEGTALLTAQYPQYKAQIEAYFSRWGEMLGGEIPGMLDLIRELKAKKYPLYGLTNWSVETLPLAWEQYESMRLLDGVVVSGEEKTIKPNPELFNRLLSRFGLQAPDCIFIDDNADNITAAQKLGFQTHHFQNQTALRAFLQQESIL